MSSLLFASLLIAVLAVPLVAGLVPQNKWYGLRTKHTAADAEVWLVANKASGIALLVSGAGGAALSQFATEALVASWLLVGCLTATGLGIAVAVKHSAKS